MNTDMKTYILELKEGGQKKVTVPANWKLTFGPICPGSKDGSYNSGGAVALPFYSGNNKKKKK